MCKGRPRVRVAAFLSENTGSGIFLSACRLNHACVPSCHYTFKSGSIEIRTLRPIKKGEEVRYNYNYDLVDAFDNPCNCGAENCLGYMVGDDHFKKLKKLLRKREKKEERIKAA